LLFLLQLGIDLEKIFFRFSFFLLTQRKIMFVKDFHVADLKAYFVFMAITIVAAGVINLLLAGKYRESWNVLSSLEVSSETLPLLYSVYSQVSIISSCFCVLQYAIRDPLCSVSGEIVEGINSKRWVKLTTIKENKASSKTKLSEFAADLSYLKTSVKAKFTDLGEVSATEEYEKFLTAYVGGLIDEMDTLFTTLIPVEDLSIIETNSRSLFSYLKEIQKSKSSHKLFQKLFKDWCEGDDSKLHLHLLEMEKYKDSSGSYEALRGGYNIASSFSKLDIFLPVDSFLKYTTLKADFGASMEKLKTTSSFQLQQYLQKADFSSISILLMKPESIEQKEEFLKLITDRFFKKKSELQTSSDALFDSNVAHIADRKFISFLEDLGKWSNGSRILRKYLESQSIIDIPFARQLMSPLLENHSTPDEDVVLKISVDGFQNLCSSVHIMLSSFTGPHLSGCEMLPEFQKYMKLCTENEDTVLKSQHYQQEIKSLLNAPFLDFNFNYAINTFIPHSPLTFSDVMLILLEKLLFLVNEIKQLNVENPLAETSITSISIIRDNTGQRSGLYLHEIPNKWILRYTDDFPNLDVMPLIHSVNMKSLLHFETSITPSVQLTISGKTLPLVREQYSILFWLYVPNHDSGFRGILRWGANDNVRTPGLWVHDHEHTSTLHFRISTTKNGNAGSDCADIPLKRWNHVSVHRNYDWFAVYLNGQFSCHFRIDEEIIQNQEDSLFIPPTSQDRGSNDDSRLKLDKIVFSNHPLSTEAISSWYQKGRDFNLIR
jgi:hypothetical protein